MSDLTRKAETTTPPQKNPPGIDRHTGRFRTLSVLCVYEDPLFLDRVCRNLEREGDIFVEISVSVEDALHLMVYVFFDVIVTDFTFWDDMPNGFLKSVRNEKKEVPFIYFTHSQNAGIAREARQQGNVRFILWNDGSAIPFDELSRAIHEMAGPAEQ